MKTGHDALGTVKNEFDNAKHEKGNCVWERKT
jgi:hypothetical protein